VRGGASGLANTGVAGSGIVKGRETLPPGGGARILIELQAARIDAAKHALTIGAILRPIAPS
jgi:hypothetical protein